MEYLIILRKLFVAILMILSHYIHLMYCFLVYDQYNKVCGTYEISFNALSNEFYSSYNRGLMGNIINVNTNDAFCRM